MLAGTWNIAKFGAQAGSSIGSDDQDDLRAPFPATAKTGLSDLGVFNYDTVIIREL
jgi:hypothetical protein